ncbi:DUF3102 domain-containing protein [Limosilactobacillus antri]|uniref:DUF3102 domain-containing protein n=1 Tax=Limosilactobacillus antri TaxID=227943 RepID=UPI001F57933E|nr:DUF3102 domain-containing protein [Limosilactobacillus antri]
MDKITTEIKTYQSIGGQAIFEIGRRINWVKKHDLAHGEFLDWLKQINMNRHTANKFMTISKKLSNGSMSNHLGLDAMYLIATMPPEERDKPQQLSNGETKKPENMTVRELRETKRKLKLRDQELADKEAQIADQQAELEENRRTQVELNRRNAELSKQQPEPKVIIKTVTKEVKPDDYDQIKERLVQLEEQSKKDKEDVAYYQRELQASENRRKQSESDDHLKELELKRKKRDAQIDAYSVSLKITDFLPELQKITQDDIQSMGEEAQHNLRTRIDMVRQTIDNIDAMFDGPRVIEGEITNEN